jgi:CheY-like chemotaxis protein
MSRVMLAEDDPEMRSLVAEALRKDGHEIIEAGDGGQMLQRLEEILHHDHSSTSVDIIVTDHRMPVCTGLDVVERLAHARWRIPCILMTAFGDEEVRWRAESAGATLIDKPLSLQQLREAVARLARR